MKYILRGLSVVLYFFGYSTIIIIEDGDDLQAISRIKTGRGGAWKRMVYTLNEDISSQFRAGGFYE